MIEEDTIGVFIDKHYFVVVKAKRTEVIQSSNPKAQPSAQIKFF